MSPEMFRQHPFSPHAADVWSLVRLHAHDLSGRSRRSAPQGVILFVMVMGYAPYAHGSERGGLPVGPSFRRIYEGCAKLTRSRNSPGGS